MYLLLVAMWSKELFYFQQFQRGALVTSTHRMGLNTTPTCDSWFDPFFFKQGSRCHLFSPFLHVEPWRGWQFLPQEGGVFGLNGGVAIGAMPSV